MHVLVGHHLDDKRNDAGALLIEERFYPVRTGDIEGGIEPDRDVAVTLAFIEQVQY
jgi:hypothetical protein